MIVILIILTSVKDKDNLFDFNIWSGGDYLKNTTGINSDNVTLEPISYNGENSFKLVKPAGYTSNSYYSFTINISESDVGKSLIFSARVYSPDNIAWMSITENNDYNSLEIPQNTKFEKFTLSNTISSNKIYKLYVILNRRDNPNGESVVFVDDLIAKIQ